MRLSKSAVTALAIIAALGTGASAQERPLDDLFEALRSAGPSGASQIAEKISAEMSRSGSAAMDLLLERGREALEAGDARRAAGHFSALTDHAPDFAEGWHSRATAWFALGEHGLALQDLRRALALEPRHFGAMTGVALIFEEIGMPEAALAAWRQVQGLHPHHEALDGALRRLELQVEGTRL